jgi:hypothetical protein
MPSPFVVCRARLLNLSWWTLLGDGAPTFPQCMALRPKEFDTILQVDWSIELGTIIKPLVRQIFHWWGIYVAFKNAEPADSYDRIGVGRVVRVASQ